MINPISYENTIKTLRNIIASCAKIKLEHVLNALSARGTDLSDVISETKTYSFSMSDTFILFELLKVEDGENYVTPKDDDHMLVISEYKFHIMIYGNGSYQCTDILRATFKNPTIAQELRDMGIYVKTITSGESINEFMNNTLLLRNDLEIKMQIVDVIENARKGEYFNYQNLTCEDAMLIIHEV